MRQSNTILLQGIFWLLFFSYPILAFRDQVQPTLLSWLWHPSLLLFSVIFPLFFYLHWKVFLPRFFAARKYFTYFTAFLLSAIVIIWTKPIDHLIFRGLDRSLRQRGGGHIGPGRNSGPPPGDDFLIADPTSLRLFLFLWFLGMAIWLYQRKLKPLLSLLSKQIEAAETLSEKKERNTNEDAIEPQPEKNTETPAESYLTVYVEYEPINILFGDIEYIEAFDGYVKIYCSNVEKPVFTRATLRSISEKLPEEKFVRIHRSYIISADKVSAWFATKVRLKSGQSLPVGRRFKGGFNL